MSEDEEKEEEGSTHLGQGSPHFPESQKASGCKSGMARASLEPYITYYGKVPRQCTISAQPHPLHTQTSGVSHAKQVVEQRTHKCAPFPALLIDSTTSSDHSDPSGTLQKTEITDAHAPLTWSLSILHCGMDMPPCETPMSDATVTTCQHTAAGGARTRSRVWSPVYLPTYLPRYCQ